MVKKFKPQEWEAIVRKTPPRYLRILVATESNCILYLQRTSNDDYCEFDSGLVWRNIGGTLYVPKTGQEKPEDAENFVAWLQLPTVFNYKKFLAYRKLQLRPNIITNKQLLCPK